MKSSLEKLTENLYGKENKYKNFNHMKRHYADNLELLCQKGYYPYEWVDDISKLDYDGLPPIHAFSSRLNQFKLDEEEYKHALRVYVEIKCNIFRDDHEM